MCPPGPLDRETSKLIINMGPPRLNSISDDHLFVIENYTAKVGQDNVNIGVVTIFRLANTSLLQVY